MKPLNVFDLNACNDCINHKKDRTQCICKLSNTRVTWARSKFGSCGPLGKKFKHSFLIVKPY